MQEVEAKSQASDSEGRPTSAGKAPPTTASNAPCLGRVALAGWRAAPWARGREPTDDDDGF